MQPLNLSFRRLLYRKLGELKPKDVAEFERLTALRHQLSEEKRLTKLPKMKDLKNEIDKWKLTPRLDPTLIKIFDKWLSTQPSDSDFRATLESILSNPPAEPKLKEDLEDWLKVAQINDALNNLDKEINKIFLKDKGMLLKLHRYYVKNRKVALKQTHFFQHHFKKYW